MHELILRNVSRHVALNGEEEQYFRSILKIRTLRKRQYLLQAGDVCHFETFVNRGCLRAFTTNNKGEEHTAMFAIEDWWISDLFSFLTGTPASQHIEALEETEVTMIEKNDLENLYLKVPKFDRFMRIILQNAFVANQQRVLASISQTAEEKYLNFIKKYPAMEQRIPQHQIASYLGITPETISRIRKNQMR